MRYFSWIKIHACMHAHEHIRIFFFSSSFNTQSFCLTPYSQVVKLLHAMPLKNSTFFLLLPKTSVTLPINFYFLLLLFFYIIAWYKIAYAIGQGKKNKNKKPPSTSPPLLSWDSNLKSLVCKLIFFSLD